MLIKDVINYVEEIKKLDELHQDDVNLITHISKHFIQEDPHAKLTPEDELFLLQCFAIRWKKTFNTLNDYTLNPSTVNMKWVVFAKELALVLNKNYLHILMPTIINLFDYNNLSPLSETTRLENFFVGFGGTLLYRKRAFCELLMNTKFILGIRRNKQTSNLSPLHIEELYRLAICQQLNGQFSIDDEEFKNFWDFLRKKVFTRLQISGEVPIELLPQLCRLVETYYKMKKENAHYTLFKKEAIQFFTAITQCDIHNSNYFYGIELQFKDKHIYFLDLFIQIYKSEQYDLDDYLNVLAHWLYRFNPILKIDSKLLNGITPSLISNSNAKISILDTQDKAVTINKSCLKLIVSMFTCHFDYFPFTEQKISLWDKVNNVSHDAGLMASIFMPLIQQNKVEELDNAYQYVLKNIIFPSIKEQSFFSAITRFDLTNTWWKLIAQEEYSKLRVFWFAPEVMLDALLRFHRDNPVISEKINQFLDQLIRTYALNHHDLMKQFRVNILFSHFLKTLMDEYQKELLMLLELIPDQNAKINFLKNCMQYITNRLSQMASIEVGHRLNFFSNVIENDRLLTVIVNEDLYTLGTVVDAFKDLLYSKTLKMDEVKLIKMKEYLQLLHRPILSIAEQEEAMSFSQPKDYIGSNN